MRWMGHSDFSLNWSNWSHSFNSHKQHGWAFQKLSILSQMFDIWTDTNKMDRSFKYFPRRVRMSCSLLVTKKVDWPFKLPPKWVRMSWSLAVFSKMIRPFELLPYLVRLKVSYFFSYEQGIQTIQTCTQAGHLFNVFFKLINCFIMPHSSGVCGRIHNILSDLKIIVPSECMPSVKNDVVLSLFRTAFEKSELHLWLILCAHSTEVVSLCQPDSCLWPSLCTWHQCNLQLFVLWKIATDNQKVKKTCIGKLNT